MVLVDDEVAAAQVRERLERAPADTPLTRGPLTEDLRIGQQDEAEVSPDQTASRRRDGEHEPRISRQLFSCCNDTRFDAPKEVLLPQRLAEMREGDDDALSGTHERRQLVLRFGQPTSDERRPLRLEGERLSGGKRVEERSLAERHRLEALFLPDRPDLAGLPYEIGTARHGPHQIGRNRSRRTVVPECRLDEIQATLDGRIDDGRLDGVKRALRERRERAHLLDLVSPELDAERLPSCSRKDVDETTADRELPPLVGTLHPFVAGERKRLGELLEAELFAQRDADRLRPGVRRGHRLCQRRGRSGNEPARGEDVEGASPLADEVWRGVQAGAPVHAPARQHRDPFVAEEPRGAFCRVTCVLILGSEQNERALELLVEGGEQQR